MENQSTTDRIKEVITPLLDARSVKVVDMGYRQEGGRMTLRVLVDKADGITMDECALLNREMGEALDKADTIIDSYVLEVCSPGLDRPIVTKEDFLRVKGKSIEVFLKRPVGDKKQYSGILRSAGEDSIFLEVNAGAVEIPFDAISKGRLNIEISKKKGRGGTR